VSRHQPSLLDHLMDYRADLERDAEVVRRTGDAASYEIIELLLKQCDFLIEKARQEQQSS
jgi:hypothetical protein